MTKRSQAALFPGVPDEDSSIGKGVRLRDTGDFTGAIAAFREASRDREQFVRATALWQIGNIFLEEFGDTGAAIAPLRQAWELDHPDVAPLAAIDLGLAYESAGQLGQARAAFEWVWELNEPRYSPYVAIPLSRVLFAAGEADEARRILEEAAAGPEKSRAALAHRYLGDLDQAAGDVQSAQSHYELALQTDVEDAPEVRVALALLQANQGLEKEARKNYEQALADGVAHGATIRYILASLQAQSGAWSEALKNYELVWEADDEEFHEGRTKIRANAAGMLAQLYKKAGDIAAARRAAQYAAEHGSDRVAARALYCLAAIDAADGNGEAARAGFNKALQRAAGTMDLPEALLGLARLDEREGQFKVALRGYQRLMKSKDETLQSVAGFGEGRVLAKLGDSAGARAAYEAVLQGPASHALREMVSRHLKALDEGTASKETTRHLGSELASDVDNWFEPTE